jgi:hypothetical protein
MIYMCAMNRTVSSIKCVVYNINEQYTLSFIVPFFLFCDSSHIDWLMLTMVVDFNYHF